MRISGADEYLTEVERYYFRRDAFLAALQGVSAGLCAQGFYLRQDSKEHRELAGKITETALCLARAAVVAHNKLKEPGDA